MVDLGLPPLLMLLLFAIVVEWPSSSLGMLRKKPEAVTNIRVKPNATSMIVTWDDNEDNPPDVELESFRVIWSEYPLGSLPKQQNLGREKNVTIQDLQPNTTYMIRVEAKQKHIDENSDGCTITATAAAEEPETMTNLPVKPNTNTMNVNWDDNEDNPPDVKLESFSLIWSEYPLGSLPKQQNSGRENNVTIQDLQPNTTYMITVEAEINLIDQFSVASTITATTAVGVPSLVENITSFNETLASLIVSWREPTNVTGVLSFYNVTLWSDAPTTASAAVSPHWNKIVNVTQAEFDGLDVGKEYIACVAACNTEHCGDVVNGSVWTSPPVPQVEETVSVVETSDRNPLPYTITIQLPLLANPPGWHYVTVKMESKSLQTSNVNQVLMDDALKLVESEEDGNGTTSQHLDNLGSMYIAALVYQEGKERLKVTLGDDTIYDKRYKNHPLAEDTPYYSVVVMEKRNGHVSQRWPSTPLRFVVPSGVHTGEVLGLIFGMVVMVVVLSVVAAVCLRKYSERTGKYEETVHYNTAATYDKEEPPQKEVVSFLGLDDEHVYEDIDELKLDPSCVAAAGFGAPPSKEDDDYLIPRSVMVVVSSPETKGGAM